MVCRFPSKRLTIFSTQDCVEQAPWPAPRNQYPYPGQQKETAIFFTFMSRIENGFFQAHGLLAP